MDDLRNREHYFSNAIRVAIQYRRCSDIWKIPLAVQDNTELCIGTLKTSEGILCMTHSLQTKMGGSLDTLWSYFSTQSGGMAELVVGLAAS